MHYYMAELSLNGATVWVIGGGAVATRKIGGLLTTGAQILVIAPEFSAAIARWQEHGDLQTQVAWFKECDLDRGVRPLLVFAATGSARMNRAIAGYCRDRGLLCNSADAPGVSGFLVPAVVRRGGLTVAVGTQGASPALSRLLKERIDRWLEPGWQGLVSAFGMLRTEVTRRLPDPVERSLFWRQTALLAEQQGCQNHPDPQAWLLERIHATASEKRSDDPSS